MRLIFLTLIMVMTIPLFSQRRKTIVFKEIEIQGTIQKPEAIYFLSRARFNYKTLDLNVSFMKKVEEAVHSDAAF